MPEYDYVLDNPSVKCTQPLLCCLIVTVGFIATSLLINTFVTQKFWHPEIPVLTDRFEKYRQKIDKIEVVVIGSSHVYYGFHEAAFGKATMQEGQPLNAFNFGVEALSMAERRSIVELICTETPPNLKCVLVEPEIRMIADADDLLARRNRYQFTPANVLELSKSKWNSNRPLKKRLGSALVPIAGCLTNLVNLGVGADILLPATVAPKRVDLGRNHDDCKIDHQWNGPKRFESATAQVQNALEKLSQPNAFKSRDLTKSEFATIKKDLELLNRLEIPIGLIFPPTTKGFEEDSAIRSFAKSKDYPWIISLTPDSKIWKQFASGEVWYDTTHLNEQGAKKMSVLLAIDVLDKLKSISKN